MAKQRFSASRIARLLAISVFATFALIFFVAALLPYSWVFYVPALVYALVFLAGLLSAVILVLRALETLVSKLWKWFRR